METIVTADWVKTQQTEAIARVQKLDRSFLVAQCVILLVGVFLLIKL